MKKVYIYKRFERFWHWSQAALILTLALTGFEIHGNFEIFGFESAVHFHETAAILLMVLIALAIFWHFATGEWKQYIPTTHKLKQQIEYYATGMFKGAPHPTEKTSLSKLNPLQRLVYLGFKLFLVPVTVISGVLYLTHKTLNVNQIVVVKDIQLDTIAFWHTLGAFLLIAFLIVHVYMTTTGHTPTSNIKAMITGYEDLEEESGCKEETIKEQH